MTGNTTTLHWSRFPHDGAAATTLAEFVGAMPRLHADVAAGRLCPRRAAKTAVAALMGVIANNVVRRDRQGLYLFTAAGFATAFAERHLQGTGEPAGRSLIEAGPQAATWFERMAALTEAVAPRLGVREYWLALPADAGPTFTGARGEHVFRQAVQTTTGVTTRLVELLQPIAAGERDLVDARAALREHVAHATEQMASLRVLVKAFDRRTAEFSTGMRQYLASYPLRPDGLSMQGPNAANIPSVPAADFLVGAFDARYAALVRERRPWFPAAEQARLQAIMAGRRDLVDGIARALDLPSDVLRSMPADALAGVITTAPAAVRSALTEVAALIQQLTFWSAAHWGGAIVQHVVKAADRIAPETLARCPVSNQAGVSGGSLDNAHYISELRRTSFLATTMQRALRMALPAANDPAYHSDGNDS